MEWVVANAAKENVVIIHGVVQLRVTTRRLMT